MKTIQPILNITKLLQVCIVVRDVDKSMESMWNNFGIGPWNIVNVTPDIMSEMTYHGKPAKFGFKAALTQQLIGGIEIELIQPTVGNTTYSDHLKEFGEGIHHLGHHKIDTYENLLKITHDLEKAGFPSLMTGRTPPGAFSYIDTRKVLNTNLELAWDNPKAILPPPDYVYPKK